MSTDSPQANPSEQFRTLANLLDELEADGYDVVDAEPTAGPHGRLHATVEINTDSRGTGSLEPQVETDAEAACSECGESHDNGACWDDVDEQQSAVGEREVAPDTNEEIIEAVVDATADEDTDFSKPADVAPGSVAAEVLKALREEGESVASELELVTGVSTIYHALNQLEDQDLIATRADPDDGRRTLYRPAEIEIDEVADDQDEDDDPEEPVEVWCGICGEGPYQRLSTHASHRHDGDVVPLDHEPSEEELKEADDEEDSPEELPELDELTVPEHVTFDAVHGAVDDCDTAWGVANTIEWDRKSTRRLLTEMELLEELPSPNARPDKMAVAEEPGSNEYREPGPYEIVDQSDVPARLDLPDLLEAAEACDTLREAADELGVGDVLGLTEAYWRLDLKEQGRPRFIGDVDERIAAIREEVDR